MMEIGPTPQEQLLKDIATFLLGSLYNWTKKQHTEKLLQEISKIDLEQYY